MTGQAKPFYSHYGKALEKQVKTIKNQCGKQIKVTEEHGKQVPKSNVIIKKDNYGTKIDGTEKF